MTLPIDEPLDNPRNPRRHPEEQIAKLVSSLRKFGQPRPILLRKANKMIITGHGLRLAMKRAGLGEIEAILWDVDQLTADQFMLADNRFGQLGEDDASRIAELLGGVPEDDWGALGFSEDEVHKLLGEAEDSIEVREVPTSEVGDRFWISCRGPLKQQAHALKALREALAKLPEVTVELGTIADDL